MEDRRTLRAFRLSAAALLSIAAVALTGNSASSAPTELSLSLCAPDSNTFSANVTNPFFPLPAGQQWVLVGKEGSENLGLRITVLGGTERFYRGKDAVSAVRVRRQSGKTQTETA